MNEGRRWENIPKSEIHPRTASGEPAELSLRMRIKVRQKSRACANCKSSRMSHLLISVLSPSLSLPFDHLIIRIPQKIMSLFYTNTNVRSYLTGSQ